MQLIDKDVTYLLNNDTVLMFLSTYFAGLYKPITITNTCLHLTPHHKSRFDLLSII